MSHTFFSKHPLRAGATLGAVVLGAALLRADGDALDSAPAKVGAVATIALAACAHPALGLVAAAAVAAAFFERNLSLVRAAQAARVRLPVEAPAGERYEGIQGAAAGTEIASLAAEAAPGGYDLARAMPTPEVPRSVAVPFRPTA